MTIRTRLIALFLIIGTIPLFFVETMFFSNMKQSVLQSEIEQHHLEVTGLVQQGSLLLRVYEAIPFVLKGVPPVQGMVRARLTGIDEADSSTLDQWRNRLEAIFLAYMKSQSDLYQVRFLDENGMELVRGDHSVDGSPRIAPQADLQNKSDRPYFIEANRLANGQIYVSPMELNQERSRIEVPHRPVFRLATPVFDGSGVRRGLIIINVNASSFIEAIRSGMTGDLIMADQDGHLLIHPDETKAFSRDLKSGHNIFKDMPSIGRQIADKEYFEAFDSRTHEFWFVRKFFYNPADSSKYWLLITRHENKDLFEPVNRTRAAAGIIGLVAIAVILILAIAAAQTLAVPVRALERRVRTVAGGDLDHEIKGFDGRMDEIGSLGRAFEEMRRSLRESSRMLLTHQDALNRTAITAMTDAKGKIVYVNDRFCAVSGYTREELIGQDHRIVNSGLHPKDFWSDFWTTIQSGRIWRGEVRNRAKNGSHYWVDTTVVPIKGPNGLPEKYFSIRYLITDRKRAEELLKVNEERLSLLFDLSQAARQSPGLDAYLRFMLGAVCRSIGWSVGHVYRNENGIMVPTGLWYPAEDSTDAAFRALTMATSFKSGVGLPGRVLESGKPLWIEDVTQDGNFPRAAALDNLGFKAAVGFPVFDAEGRVALMIELFSRERMDADPRVLEIVQHVADLTSQISNRKKLEEQQAQLAAVVRASDEAIYYKTLDGVIGSWNHGAEQMYGYAAAEVIGKSADILMPPSKKGELEFFLSELKQGRSILQHETERVRKDGAVIQVSITLSPVVEKDGMVTAVSVIARDITESVRIKKQMEVFNQAAVGREERMIELKREINELSRRLGKTPPYDLSFLTQAPEGLT